MDGQHEIRKTLTSLSPIRVFLSTCSGGGNEADWKILALQKDILTSTIMEDVR